MDSLAPDLIEPVVGFRVWRLMGGELRSPYVDVYWREPVMHAVCRQTVAGRGPPVSGKHPSPDPRCTCGIYALFTPPHGFSTPIDAVGIVTVWGRLQVHPGGMRAEHARIEALGVHLGWRGARNDASRAIAERMGVDVLDRGELAELGSRYGSPLPTSMIPSEPTP